MQVFEALVLSARVRLLHFLFKTQSFNYIQFIQA